MADSVNTGLFIEIIQMSLGARDYLSRTPNEDEWVKLFNEAQKQAIVGVLINGIERLPNAQRPPHSVLMQWIGLVQIIETIYSLQCERAKELTKFFSSAGYLSCILKGLGFAQYYSEPTRRQGGDIDLWVDGKREDVMKWLRRLCPVKKVVWHHVDAKIFEDVETEIHFHPGWLYNPFKNRILQKWFDNNKRKQMNVVPNLGYAYPMVSFNAIFALVHLWHHFIEEGIGIRHILDYYYILKVLPAENREEVFASIKRFGLIKLAEAMMWVLQEVCGMPSKYLICEANEKEGRFLLDEIMCGGNFGKYRSDNLRKNTAARFFTLLPHYPSEVLWVIPWKMWHKGWRMLHG